MPPDKEHEFLKSEFAKEHVSLKEFLMAIMNERELKWEQRIIGVETNVQTAMSASDKAIAKAEDATTNRFASVNEFRAQLADQQDTFARKDEVNIKLEAMEKTLAASVAFSQTSSGRQSGFSTAGTVIVIVLTLLIAAIGMTVTILSKHQ